MSTLVRRGLVVFLVVLFSVVSPLVASESTGENIVQNGSFEELNDDGIAAPYSFAVYQGDAKVTIDSSMARTGQNSVRIEGDGDSRGLFTTSVEVVGGTMYRASLWYRTSEKIELGTVRMRLMAYYAQETSDENKATWESDWLLDPYEGDFQIGGQNFHVQNWQAAVDQWRLLTVSFKLPEDVVALRIEGFNWLGDGVVWFDDLSLVEIAPDS